MKKKHLVIQAPVEYLVLFQKNTFKKRKNTFHLSLKNKKFISEEKYQLYSLSNGVE